MNDNTRVELSKMSECGLIDKDKCLKFYGRKRVNNDDIVDFFRDAIGFTPDDIEAFKVKIFDSWDNCDTVFKPNEIAILSNLLKKGGVMTRKDLIKETKIHPNKISGIIAGLKGESFDDSIDGLLEEKLIETMPIHNCEILVFINKNKFYSFLGKNGTAKEN